MNLDSIRKFLKEPEDTTEGLVNWVCRQIDTVEQAALLAMPQDRSVWEVRRSEAIAEYLPWTVADTSLAGPASVLASFRTEDLAVAYIGQLPEADTGRYAIEGPNQNVGPGGNDVLWVGDDHNAMIGVFGEVWTNAVNETAHIVQSQPRQTLLEVQFKRALLMLAASDRCDPKTAGMIVLAVANTFRNNDGFNERWRIPDFDNITFG